MPRIAASSNAVRYGRERMTATGSMASAPAAGEAATGPAADGGVDGSCESVIRCASLNETTQTVAALQWTQLTPDDPAPRGRMDGCPADSAPIPHCGRNRLPPPPLAQSTAARPPQVAFAGSNSSSSL